MLSDAPSPNRKVLLSARGISMSYKGETDSVKRLPVLQNVNLEVAAGEAVALVGENGSGKSTLLRICAGVQTPTKGAVKRNRVGYCPQESGLMDLLSVSEHIEYFGRAHNMNPLDSMSNTNDLLKKLGFQNKSGGVKVKNLSGGNRQKLSLALALLGETDVLLLDEPDQGFDLDSQAKLWDVLAEMRQGRATVIVSHLMDRANMERKGIQTFTVKDLSASIDVESP